MNSGDTYVCISSGPSLRNEDLSLLKTLGGRVIVVNNTWEIYPGADIIFAGDYAWWETYYSRIWQKKDAELWTCDLKAAKYFSLHYFDGPGSYNSGLRAIELAIYLGARRVFLLGYDCSLKYGKHWHGPHAFGLQNPSDNSITGWKKQFRRLQRSPPAEIINCSSYTELDTGIRMSLQDAAIIFGRETDHNIQDDF